MEGEDFTPELVGNAHPASRRCQNTPSPWSLKLALARADFGRLFQQAARWALAIRTGGDLLNLVPQWEWHRRGQTSVSPEAARVLLAMALNPNRLRLNEVVRLPRRVMALRGIEDGRSDSPYLRFLKDFRDRNFGHWLFHREGEKARNDGCDPYLRRDYRLIEVGDALVADGHKLNFEILPPYTGKPHRLALLLFYDLKSSYPCGWEIMPPENTQGIARALRRAILRLGKIPLCAYLDNHKAFGAKFFSGNLAAAGFAGLFARLGVQVIHAWPYHGESKTLERFFKTFGELEGLTPTYTGAEIETRPPRPSFCGMRRSARWIAERGGYAWPWWSPPAITCAVRQPGEDLEGTPGKGQEGGLSANL